MSFVQAYQVQRRVIDCQQAFFGKALMEFEIGIRRFYSNLIITGVGFGSGMEFELIESRKPMIGLQMKSKY